ncbi:HNH Endonuclease [Bodo saltans virus]|uniref:HNH Endonuclease n=1 Tax=Bodo saltans virus TaxID=2024608 RepID=A0A2H4UTY3_9VIRU|nr:HNH Endonuclease [Bodo saltans virus]ATZ80401.1 HNH Endonuclease [Bodo saltans virus]
MTSMKEEIWKKIENVKYCSVSNYGNVRNDNTDKIFAKNKKNGYLYTYLSGVDGDTSNRIHILVAQAFVKNDNPATKTQVNHMDGNKTNNRADNLEWVSQSDNMKHAVKEGLLKTQARKIHQYDKEGKLIKTYDSIAQASEATGVDDGSICKVCKGTNMNKTAGGFIWKYEDEDILCPCPTSKDEPLTKIKDFPNYGVSTTGQVYSYTRNRYLTQNNMDGYKRVHIVNDTGRKGMLVHRLVAETFIKNPDSKSLVFHIDGDKTNNNVNNLKWY